MDDDRDDDRTLATSRLLPFHREAVFAAFREPQRLARWWGPAGFANTFEAFDFRPGGRWKFVMHGPDGKDYRNESTFRETSPQRVVIRHDSAPGFTLYAALAEEGRSTRLEWRQVFDTRELREQLAAVCIPANEQNLDRLEAELARAG